MALVKGTSSFPEHAIIDFHQACWYESPQSLLVKHVAFDESVINPLRIIEDSEKLRTVRETKFRTTVAACRSNAKAALSGKFNPNSHAGSL